MKQQFLAIATFGLMLIGGAGAASGSTILSVDFETSDGFTVDADGAAVWERRTLSDTGPEPVFTSGGSQSGMIFFGLPDSSSAAPTITLDPVDLTGYTDVQLRISLAATEGKWESTQVDGVLIEIVAGGGVVDQFLPDASSGADLESQLFGVDLGTQFQDFIYDLSGPLGLMSIEIAVRGTSSTEKLGIDSIQVVGTAAPTPEPASALLFGVGALIVGSAIRRRRSATS